MQRYRTEAEWMHDPHPEPETTMFAALLERLRRDDVLNVKRMAQITGLDQTTIMRWCTGQTDPQFRNVHLIFQGGGFDVQAAILNDLVGDTGWFPTYIEDTLEDLDINGDGRIDLADSIAAQLNALHNLSDLLQQVDRDRSGDRRLTDAGVANYLRLMDQVFRSLVRGKRVIEHIHRNQPRRRKARAAKQ